MPPLSDEGVYLPVKNIVMVLLWLPVVVLVNGAVASLVRYLWRVSGSANATISSVPIQSQTALLALAAVLGGIGLLYYLLAGETFGWQQTEEAVETVEDTLND